MCNLEIKENIKDANILYEIEDRCMNKFVCKENMCTGCRACIDKCMKDAISIKDALDSFNAVIDESKCIDCGACHKVCPNNSPVELKEQLSWHQGWADDKEEREKSSSGGFATVLSKSFVKNGGVVCSCSFMNGDFVFEAASLEEEVERFRGSKYVKSNPRGIYKKIKKLLKEQKKVLFIGLPCQVAAVKNFVGENDEKNLYTVDLICHGTPSVEILKKYLEQYNVNLKDVKEISFRTQNSFMLKKNEKPIIDSRIQDRYTMTFLSSLNYTENCYSCRYATDKRVGDITIGDSWGSELMEEIEKGISLVMCQTEKGEELLKLMPFHFEEVDDEKAKLANHQLRHPSIAPEKRKEFFEGIKKGKKYDAVVAKIYPKACLKQRIKKILYSVRGAV